MGSTEAAASSLPKSGSPAPIWSLARDCVTRYESLHDHLQTINHDQASNYAFDRDVVLASTQDARVRFKAWATNIAALQEAHLKSSLDSRLREATEIRGRLLKILEGLRESLIEAALIVTGDKVNETWEVGALSDFECDSDLESNPKESESKSLGETAETSRLAELLAAAKIANSNLMDISIVIRNTPTRDDYNKAATRYSLDPRWDIGHVQEKFGSAKRSSDWLIQRLGKSITRRRQYLTYRKEHHDKLSHDWDEIPKDIVELKEDDQPEKTIALTKATTFVEAKLAPQKDGSEVGSFGTETSYDQTVAGGTQEHQLTVPGPPAEAFEGVPFLYGEPFQCPYCYTEQNVKNRNAWKYDSTPRRRG